MRCLKTTLAKVLRFCKVVVTVLESSGVKGNSRDAGRA